MRAAKLISAAAATFRGHTQGAQVARGAVGVFLVNVVGTALNVVLQIWLARLLGAEEFGVYVYVLAWLNMLLVISIMGYDNATLRFLASYKGTGRIQEFWGFLHYARNRVALLSTVTSLALGVVIWAVRNDIGSHQATVFWLGCVLLPINTFIAFSGAVLQSLKRVIQSQSVQYVVRLGAMFGLLILFHFGFRRTLDAPLALSINVVSAAIALAVLLYFTARYLPPRAPPQSCVDQRRNWRGYSRGLFLISGSQLLLSQVDILLVGMLIDTTQAGIYAAASRIAALVAFGITSVNSVIAPVIAELFSKKEHVELQSTVTLAARGVLIYTLPVVLVIAVLGDWLLGLFGQEFVIAYPILITLCVGQIVIAACGSVGFLLTMTGNQKDAVKIIFLSGSLAVLLNAIFIPAFGLIGAAAATMIATAFRSIVLSVAVRRRLGIRPTAFGV